jgi:peptidoglycan/xylan/chitin deacetylase (PgdA/CDA1 family)
VIFDLLVALTFDIEKDCCPFLNTTIGIEVGLPRILNLLERYDIECTFFITGEVAELFPDTVREIARRHEISSHGYRHETFDKMTLHRRNIIKQSKKVLEKTANQKVIGFRAPRFLISRELFEALAETGFRYDSSITYFRPRHLMIKTSFPEFRVQLPSALLNFPNGLQVFRTMCRVSSFPVIFFHCWEAVDVRSLLNSADTDLARIRRHFRPDMWINTGNVFLKRLTILVKDLLDSGFRFTTLQNVVVSSGDS